MGVRGPKARPEASRVPEVNSPRVATIKVLGTKQLRTHVLAAKRVTRLLEMAGPEAFCLRGMLEKASFAATWAQVAKVANR
jgi:hypothetical protein